MVAEKSYGKCPQCGGTNIARERSPEGKTLCRDCGYAKPHAQWGKEQQAPAPKDPPPDKADGTLVLDQLGAVRRDLHRAIGAAASLVRLAAGHDCRRDAEQIYTKIEEALDVTRTIFPDDD